MEKEITDWGEIYYYDNSRYRFALYKYNDDEDYIYLSNVYVPSYCRKCGIGTLVLNKAHNDALKLNALYIRLKCRKNSWVHEWYVRNGFDDICIDADDTNYAWMEKKLQ